MEKLLELLKGAGLEVTDELKGKIAEALPTTEGTFTQEQVNGIVKERVDRLNRVHETELAELRGKVEKLVDPGQIEQVKAEFESQLTEAKTRRAADIKSYELKLAATKAGIKDLDYLEFIATKQGLYDRLEIADDGKITVKGKDGNVLENGFDGLIGEIKAEKPDLFKAANLGTGTNPGEANQTKNPWLKDTFNLTEQARILRENPTLAAQLKSAAGK